MTSSSTTTTTTTAASNESIQLEQMPIEMLMAFGTYLPSSDLAHWALASRRIGQAAQDDLYDRMIKRHHPFLAKDPIACVNHCPDNFDRWMSLPMRPSTRSFVIENVPHRNHHRIIHFIIDYIVDRKKINHWPLVETLKRLVTQFGFPCKAVVATLIRLLVDKRLSSTSRSQLMAYFHDIVLDVYVGEEDAPSPPCPISLEHLAADYDQHFLQQNRFFNSNGKCTTHLDEKLQALHDRYPRTCDKLRTMMTVMKYDTLHSYDWAMDRLEFLVENGIDVNYPCMISQDVCRLLINYGRDLNRYGDLSLAIHNLDLCRLMLASGADPNNRRTLENVIIEYVFAFAQIPLATFSRFLSTLLTSGGLQLDHPERSQSVLIMTLNVAHAKPSKVLDLVKWYIDHGANVHCLDKANGKSALHYSRHRVHIAEYLISRGVDVNAADHKRQTILHSVSSVEWVWNALELTPKCITQMAISAPTIVDLLIRSGADVNATDNKGRTPLHTCLSVDLQNRSVYDFNGDHYDAEVVGGTKLLLRLDVLMMVRIEIVKLLLLAHANVNAADCQGVTPMALAERDPNDEVVRAMLVKARDAPESLAGSLEMTPRLNLKERVKRRAKVIEMYNAINQFDVSSSG